MDDRHTREHKIVGKIEKEIEKNIKILEELFVDCNDVVKKSFLIGNEKNEKIYIMYTDGLTNSDFIGEMVLKPLLYGEIKKTGKDLLWQLMNTEIETADIKEVEQFQDAVVGILSGNTMLFVDGFEKGIMISTKSFPTRGVPQNDTEVVMRGSKDSFNESLRTNTALIRRRVRDTRLKVVQKQAGLRSQTDIAIMYVSDLVQPELLVEVTKKLKEIPIDAIFDSGMIEQSMESNWLSPFPQFQHTQRPDKVASGLLEGRIALVVDNSPEVLLLPVTFNCFFQASDDYYNRWEIATFARILRYIAAFLAIGLPGLYVAIFNFHTEVLPTSLVLSFGAARMGVPFPTVVEILIMELAFELLREAGIRMPGQMGGTIGIVGGLIVGQAAVEAGLVSTIVVIVVALTAIATFSIPNESFTAAFRLLKFFLIITSAFLGLYGFFLGLLAVAIHLAGLKSFGIPYMMPTVGGSVNQYNDKKDYIARLPIFFMKKRPIFTKDDARVRMKSEKK